MVPMRDARIIEALSMNRVIRPRPRPRSVAVHGSNCMRPGERKLSMNLRLSLCPSPVFGVSNLALAFGVRGLPPLSCAFDHRRFMVPMHAPRRKKTFHEPYQSSSFFSSSSTNAFHFVLVLVLVLVLDPHCRRRGDVSWFMAGEQARKEKGTFQ